MVCGKQQEKGSRRFTALLHHLSVGLLRGSFYALRHKASPGIHGVTWQEYETGLEATFARRTIDLVSIYDTVVLIVQVEFHHRAQGASTSVTRDNSSANYAVGLTAGCMGPISGFSSGSCGLSPK